MNWYKLAESAPNITLQKFQAMTWEKKRALAQSMELSLSQPVQNLFFTQEYDDKYNILCLLALNTIISSQTQSMFFTQEYESIRTPLQLIGPLNLLAQNNSLIPEVKRLFWKQEYKDKGHISSSLASKPSFLQGLTLQDMREFTKIKEARLPVYRARLKQIREKIKL
jgi:hypothetical protein